MQDEPLIIVLSGPVCAGKSTLAGGLASACGGAVLTTRALIAQHIDAAPDELERWRLQIRSRSTLHLSRHRTPIHKKVFFSGELPGPSCAGRTVYVSGTVPGAKRRFLVRQATTDG